MTRDEIEQFEAKLHKLQTEREQSNFVANDATVKRLRLLASRVGAEPLLVDPGLFIEAVPELIHRIHQALQTASMIDACRTAAKGHEIALEAMKETAESQQISKQTMIAAWVAALAAWAAVILPPIVRLIWAKLH